MKSLSLRTKIISHLAIISIAAISVMLGVTFRYVSHAIETDLVKRGQFVARTISEQSANPILTQKHLVLNLLLHDAKKADSDLEYLYIVNPRGEILAHTFGDRFPSELRKMNHPTATSRHLRMDDQNLVEIRAPIVDGTLGHLHVGLSKSAIQHGLVRIFLVATAIITALSLTGASILWLSLKRIVVGPIQTLEQIVLGLENSENYNLAPIAADDEIGQLANAFNKMAENLAITDIQRTAVIAQLHEANEDLTLMVKEREEAKASLAESEERLRLILDSAGEGIFGIDTTGSCTFCNLASLRLLGFSGPEELIGTNIHQFLHPAGDAGPTTQDECRICRTILKGECIHSDDELFRKGDGSSFPVEFRAYPQVKEGTFIGTVVTFADITDRKKDEEERNRLQEMLLQSQKMDAMGTLAGGIAHDFNNILTVIIGYCEVARRPNIEREKIQEIIGQIMIASNRAAELVRQILTFSRKGRVHRQPLDLIPLVKETLKLIRSSIPTTIEIRSQFEPGVITLADPTQIHQVIMNLCANAYHAIGEAGGILALSIKKCIVAAGDETLGEIPPGSYAVIEVSDTGCGMDSETRQKIFEPYFTTRPNGKGSGLGLAVVHGIVKAHDGRITVYSVPGKGTTFHVYLPLVEGLPEVTALAPSRQPGPTGGERILFADDEQQIRDVARASLPEFGYAVDVCSDAFEVLDRLRKDPFSYDLLVTDMAMPGMNGKDLAAAVLALRPDMPIILCTGYSELIEGQSAKLLGIREYLEKPVLMSTLCERIRKIFEQSAQRSSC